jgi:hypothetical protein
VGQGLVVGSGHFGTLPPAVRTFFHTMHVIFLLIVPLCVASIVLLPPNSSLPTNSTPPPQWPQFLAYDLFEQPSISAPRGIYSVQVGQEPSVCTIDYPPVSRPTLLLYDAQLDSIAVCIKLVPVLVMAELF